jgi:transcriptional regulator with XRE-family HTH domain
MSLNFVEIDPEKLRRLIEARGVTHASLAKSLRVTTKTIQRWLNGSVKQIRPETLADISRVLEASAEEICQNLLVLEQHPKDLLLEEIFSEKYFQRVRAMNEWDSYRKILKSYRLRKIPTIQRLHLYKHIGFSSLFIGKMRSGKLHLDKALEIAEALQDIEEQIFIINWLAIHCELIGKGVEGITLLERAEKLLPKVNNPACNSDFYFKRGRVFHHLERHDEAVADIRRSIVIDHRSKSSSFVTIAVKYFHMGGSYLRARNFSKARVAFTRNMNFSVKGAWIRGQTYSHMCMAVIELLEGGGDLAASKAHLARKLKNVSQFHRMDSKVEQVEFVYYVVSDLVAEAKKTVIKRLSSTRVSRLHFAYAVLDALFLAKLYPSEFQLRQSFVDKAEEVFQRNCLQNSLKILAHLREKTCISRDEFLGLYYF